MTDEGRQSNEHVDSGERLNRALTEAECMCLLASEPVGRIIYVDGVIPTAFPVNYRLIRRTVVFATRAGARLLSSAPRVQASFEIDGADIGSRSGWSVLATGWAGSLLPELAAVANLDTWLTNHRTELVGLTIDVIAGRRLEGVDLSGTVVSPRGGASRASLDTAG